MHLASVVEEAHPEGVSGQPGARGFSFGARRGPAPSGQAAKAQRQVPAGAQQRAGRRLLEAGPGQDGGNKHSIIGFQLRQELQLKSIHDYRFVLCPKITFV